MTTGDTDSLTIAARQPSVLVRFGRVVYLLATALFAAFVVLQVFLAGLTLLVNSSALETHRAFGHLALSIPLFLVPLGFLGRVPWRVTGLNLLLLVLGISQYVWLDLPAAAGFPALRALHAVNALALFWLAAYLTQVGVRLLQTPRLVVRSAERHPLSADVAGHR